MQRTLLLAVALLVLALPATAQENPLSSPSDTGRKADVNRTNNRPPEVLPHSNVQKPEVRLQADMDDYITLSDTLTESQVLRRISRLYQYQAEILAAQADGDSEHAEGLLELAMSDLNTLAQQPGIYERPRYRELYRSLITEYERYYGVSDEELVIPHADLFALRAEMFAMLDEVEDPLLEDVMLPKLTPIETTIPMTTNRLVENSVKFLLQKRQESVQKWMTRADTYFPMIEQILAEEGVPDELKYLAVVESGLNPRARSWAKAGGMWQFIVPTGRAYGLRTNAWVDERMDPEKATRAAARHLRDLHKMFGGDWQLALSGYNCSPARIKRAIRKFESRTGRKATFWDIYADIPRETRSYVPMFIAASLVLSNPEAFDIQQEQPGVPYEYDHVPVQGMLSLSDIAKMAGTTTASIQALNPELQRSSLPPTKGAYMLRLPVGVHARFAEAFEQLPDEKKATASEYVVRRGDSLGKISKKYGVSVTALRQANGMRGSTIHPGQRLVVPVPNYESRVSLADATPVTVRYGTRRVQPIAALDPVRLQQNTQPQPVVQPARTTSAPAKSTTSTSPKVTKSTPSETRIVYTVRRGDTLGKIASKYGVSVSSIKSWNKLRGTQINRGQRLYLYSSVQPPSQPERVVYRVRRGDNLTAIAKKYGVSVRSIKSWNKLRSSTIRPGQRLTIHPGQSAPAAPSYVTYRVKRGDSLGKIAKRHGTTVSKLKSWNKLRRNTIYPGQRLKIYR